MSEVQVDYEGTKMTLNGLDLSPTGMGLWGPTNCPAGTFKVSLQLDDALAPLEANARVVRQFHSDGGAVWGVAFDGLDAEGERRLQSYIARQAAAEV